MYTYICTKLCLLLYKRPVHYLYRQNDLENGGMKPSKYRDVFKQLLSCPPVPVNLKYYFLRAATHSRCFKFIFKKLLNIWK